MKPHQTVLELIPQTLIFAVLLEFSEFLFSKPRTPFFIFLICLFNWFLGTPIGQLIKLFLLLNFGIFLFIFNFLIKLFESTIPFLSHRFYWYLVFLMKYIYGFVQQFIDLFEFAILVLSQLFDVIFRVLNNLAFRKIIALWWICWILCFYCSRFVIVRPHVTILRSVEWSPVFWFINIGPIVIIGIV